MIIKENIPKRAKAARFLRAFDILRGWRRVVDYIVPRTAGLFIVKNDGLIFTGNLNSLIDREIFLYGGYEKVNIRRFLNLLPANRNNVIIDVGANIGNHSLNFAEHFKSVHAFEPNPILWEQFECNKFINGFECRIKLHRYGLSDRDANLLLHLTDAPNLGLGTFSTVEQYDTPLKPAGNCEVRRGDDFLEAEGITTVDAIKIDVQGFEPEVLRGLRRTIVNNRPIIWIEIGAGTQTQLACVKDLRMLIPYNFEIKRLDSNEDVNMGSNSRLGSGDYAIIPCT